jgi:hypothetical protein
MPSLVCFCPAATLSVPVAPWVRISTFSVLWFVMGPRLVRALPFFCTAISLVPSHCVSWLDRFVRLGGQVVEGSASSSSSRRAYVSALLIRNCSIVRAPAGVIAFVSGCSAGSWFTVYQAIRRRMPVVVFPVDGSGRLRRFAAGHWVPCRSLAGAYLFTYFKKD